MHARGFSLPKLGTLGTIPALCAIPAAGTAGSTRTGSSRRGWSLTRARKTCLVGGMLVSSVVALAAVAPSAGLALAFLAVAYAALAFTGASIWALALGRRADPAPRRLDRGRAELRLEPGRHLDHDLHRVMLTITSGSFVIPLMVAGAICLVGAASYLFVVGRIEPLPVLEGTRDRPAA